jgi:hypothetical protein
MTPKLLRLAYVFEFLVALVAIFSSWSEIGGQAALDLMHWGWKLGLGVGLAFALVGYTAALVSEDAVWSLRSARWLLAVLLIGVSMGAVTYFYALQVDTSGDPDESATISTLRSPLHLAFCRS